MIGQAGEFDFTDGPGKPIHQFAIKALVQFLRGKDSLPGVVKLGEIADGTGLLSQPMQREALQQIQMGAVRLATIYVADKRNAGEDVTGAVAKIFAAVDNGERDGGAVPEKHQHRHGHKAIQGASDGGKFGARRRFAGRHGRQIHREENVGFDFFGLEGVWRAEEQPLPIIAGQFRAGDLEEEVHGAPAGEAGILFGEGVVGIEVLLEFGQGVDRQGALTPIAKGREESAGGKVQGTLGQRGKPVNDFGRQHC